jgi:hypothetical protein
MARSFSTRRAYESDEGSGRGLACGFVEEIGRKKFLVRAERGQTTKGDPGKFTLA